MITLQGVGAERLAAPIAQAIDAKSSIERSTIRGHDVLVLSGPAVTSALVLVAADDRLYVVESAVESHREDLVAAIP